MKYGFFVPLVLLATSGSAQSLGSAFTYQGQLTETGQAANGLYDIQACLFDAPLSAVAIACAPDFEDVPVEGGVFTLALDFGAAPFVGLQRYLELRVRPGASTAGFTVLAPRQLVRPAPEALRANVASAAPWSGLTGVPAGFADGVDHDSGGTVTSIATGSGLTGGPISGSGTIRIANGGVGSVQLAADAVASAHLVDGGVAAVDLAADSVGAAQLAAAAVGASELADNAVDTAAVQNLAITQGKIAVGAVGSSQLAAAAVGLAQIDTTQVQARIAASCAAGQYFRGVAANGSVVCEPLPGVPAMATLDDPASNVGKYASIAVGNDGLPIISYFNETNFALKVAKCSNAACTAATVITLGSAVEGQTSIAIGNNGLPVISYAHATALKVYQCANAACTSGTSNTVDDPANNVGTHSAIAIGVDGFPVISYRDNVADALKVAKCVDAGCAGAASITTIDDPANDVGEFTSITVPNDGRPVISYFDATANALKVAKCANISCTGAATLTTVDDPANLVGQYTSIAIGSDQLPVISYLDISDFNLKVAKCANAACTGTATITTVDSSADAVGAFTSIASAGDGLPVIAYQDLTAGALKVAKCGNIACTGPATLTTVDDAANVGRHTALAIGSDGLPLIAYHDVSAGALKAVKCGTRGCQ